MNNNHQEMDIRHYAVLLAVVIAYGFYLFPFTLFEGFATFSNDAGSYVLMARHWSPYFAATPAELFTWPAQAYPPGFPVFLALTGASESLWAGHLAVSLCMLAALVLLGHYIGVQANRNLAIVLVAVLSLTPGIIIHSLGILSENLYLLASLGALAVWAHMRTRQINAWPWFALLFVLLAVTLLTRTVGVALAGAFLIVPLIDRKLSRRQRLVLPVIALMSIASWQLWEAFKPYDPLLTYDSPYARMWAAASGEPLVLMGQVWQLLLSNIVKLLGSWGQYFALMNTSFVSFALPYLLFVVVTISLVLRLIKLRMDAVYILFYVGIVLSWPYQDEMTRFLHPIVLLLLIQPVLALRERGHLNNKPWAMYSVVAGMVVLLAHSVYIQAGMNSLRQAAESSLPQLAHAPEYYLSTEDNQRENFAKSYIRIAEVLARSGEFIPEDSVVAIDKNPNYTLLADRKSVPLTSLVTIEQQLCNFQREKVDFVLLSSVVSQLNIFGPDLGQLYQDYTSNGWSVPSSDGEEHVYFFRMDQGKILANSILTGYECNEFRVIE